MTIYDIIGLTGVAIILMTYFLLQLGKLKIEYIRYSVLNALGAFFILLSLIFDWNLASVIIEVSWMLISIFGIYKSLKMRRVS